MKKSVFGMMLFITGTTAFLVLSIYLSMNQYNYNGMTGTFAALLGNEILLPYLLFCATGISGLAICIYETYFRK